MAEDIAPQNRSRSVLLTDWGADGERIRGDKSSVVYQIIIPSLLYDEIIIPDEIFVVSNKLARWFGNDEGLEIWRELFDIGSLAIIKHPITAYLNPSLQEFAQYNPIQARARYIEKFGSKDDEYFSPTDFQKRFYKNIELLLSQNKTIEMREAGAKKSTPIMPIFGNILGSLLQHPGYRSWRRICFPQITNENLTIFEKLFTEPESIIHELQRRNYLRNFLRDEDDIPVVNRSMAYQAANLFPSAARQSLQRLTDSAFTAAFCFRENAVGRYGGMLKAVPPLSEETTNMPNGELTSEAVAVVDAHVRLPIPMPKLDRGYGRAVAEV